MICGNRSSVDECFQQCKPSCGLYSHVHGVCEEIRYPGIKMGMHILSLLCYTKM